MWFFMNTCYGLSVLTFGMFLLAFAQSFLNFHILQAGHLTFMILTCIVYSFTETLVIFFFVGTGVSIKEYTRDHKLESGFHKRSLAIKHKVYPPLMLNILFMVMLFVLVGAVDTRRMPVWAYQFIFVACLAHYVKAKVIQHESFKENTKIILEMAGL